ncbi:MmcQ/YjbR family DNA-binding protein [Rhizobium sp. BK068]|uniref:MmcQ/YjbR family DNA-binding protein n=1 Tax=Rhizobium sp. BK068 TaxID=2512130 RepID=UPI00105117A4|nr:MmcQ/YjbR family DNA-binding protein [Rhizobium sp. BK068]TCM74949.1 putative DNA-binding protein (MmcQ/YjbR family) [Rhizobium sp. BK068]
MTNRAEILEYAKEKYGTEPSYLWSKFPDYAALRHQGSKKWYGIIMNVPKSKLGLDGEGEVDIIDIKCGPDLIDVLRDASGFVPAYHMNKEHWISVRLDGSVPHEQLRNLVDQSFELTK